MVMPGRSYSATNEYRYGFNGQEKSTEINGSDNLYTAEFWQYDSRLGRRWNVDPVVKPYESPFATLSNNPIISIDPYGNSDTTVTAAGGAQNISLDNTQNNLSFYKGSSYSINEQPVPVESGQLRSFSNDYGTFSAHWKSDGSGSYTFAGYLNDKQQTFEACVKEVSDFNASVVGKLLINLSVFGNNQLRERAKNPVSFDLKLATNLLVGAAMAAAEPIPYEGTYTSPAAYEEPLFGFAKFKSELPMQIHHFATNKNATYTPKMAEIAEGFGLNLNGAWNKQALPHLGRHPNAYHNFVLEGMQAAKAGAGGSQSIFLNLFNQYVKQPVIQNPGLLRKSGW